MALSPFLSALHHFLIHHLHKHIGNLSSAPLQCLLQIAQRVSSSGQHGHNRKSMAICLTITTHLQAPNIGASPKPATIAASPEPANCSIIMSANGTTSPPLPQTSKAHYNGGKVGISGISPMPPQSLQNPTSSGATLPVNVTASQKPLHQWQSPLQRHLPSCNRHQSLLLRHLCHQGINQAGSFSSIFAACPHQGTANLPFSCRHHLWP